MEEPSNETILEKLHEPRTPTELARIFDKHHYTMEKRVRSLKEENPTVRSKKVGRSTIYWVEELEPLEEMRELIMGSIDWTPREDLLVRLIEAEADGPEAAVKREEIPEREGEYLDELINGRRIVLTSDGRVYLTDLGREIAEGARMLTGSRDQP